MGGGGGEGCGHGLCRVSHQVLGGAGPIYLGPSLGQKIFPASGFGEGICEPLPQGSRVGLETSTAPPCDFPRVPCGEGGRLPILLWPLSRQPTQLTFGDPSPLGFQQRVLWQLFRSGLSVGTVTRDFALSIQPEGGAMRHVHHCLFGG